MNIFTGISLILASAFFMGNCNNRNKTYSPTNSSVTGTILKAMPSNESAMYTTLLVSFHNSAVESVIIVSYRITWDGGQYTGNGPKEAIPGGAKRDFRVRIYPDSGNLESLIMDPSKAHVSIIEMLNGK